MWHDQADDVEVLTKLRGFKVSIEKRKERKEKREREREREAATTAAHKLLSIMANAIKGAKASYKSCLQGQKQSRMSRRAAKGTEGGVGKENE